MFSISNLRWCSTERERERNILVVFRWKIFCHVFFPQFPNENLSFHNENLLVWIFHISHSGGFNLHLPFLWSPMDRKGTWISNLADHLDFEFFPFHAQDNFISFSFVRIHGVEDSKKCSSVSSEVVYVVSCLIPGQSEMFATQKKCLKFKRVDSRQLELSGISGVCHHQFLFPFSFELTPGFSYNFTVMWTSHCFTRWD